MSKKDRLKKLIQERQLLTPQELRTKTFSYKVKWNHDWYEADEVDDFLDRVSDTMLTLYALAQDDSD